jgi:hypothetical protein
MLFTVLRSCRDLLWVASTVAEIPVYALSGVCRAVWEGATFLFLRSLQLESSSIVQLPLLAGPPTGANVVDVHRCASYIPGLLLGVGLLGNWVYVGVAFFLRSKFFLLWCRLLLNLHLGGGRLLCSNLGRLFFLFLGS